MVTIKTTRIVCDRCGKDVPAGPGVPECHTTDTEIGPASDSAARTLDLCPACRREFFAFLTSPDRIEPKEGTYAWVLDTAAKGGARRFRRATWSVEEAISIDRYGGTCFLPRKTLYKLTRRDALADDWVEFVPPEKPPCKPIPGGDRKKRPFESTRAPDSEGDE